MSLFSNPRAPRATIALLRREAPGGFWRLCVFIGVASLGNVLLLIALSQVVAAGATGPINRYALLYALSFSLYLYAQRSAASEIAVMGEDAMACLRLRLAEGLLSRDPQIRERAAQIGVNGALMQSAKALSRDLPYAAAAAQALATTALALVFISVLSPAAFALACAVFALGVLFLRTRRRMAQQVEQEAAACESASLDALAKLSEPPDDSQARLSLFEETFNVLEAEAEAKADLGRRRFEAGAFAAMGVLAVAPIAAFVLPHATEAGAVRLLIAFLFLAAPVVSLIDAASVLASLEETSEKLLAISDHLGRHEQT